MFIAHIPAGYLLTKGLLTKLGTARQKKSLLWTGIFFAIAPDLDMFWFYLASDRTTLHHLYFTHWPLFWVALAAVLFLASALFRQPNWRPYIITGLATVMLHLVLDTFYSAMYWLAPFSFHETTLITVPAVYKWWVWNFLLHWTFLAEIFICLAALCLWRHDRQKVERARRTG